MKYLVKSFAVFIAWTYLLTCLAPYSPCYAMDTSDQEASAFVGKNFPLSNPLPLKKKPRLNQRRGSPQ